MELPLFYSPAPESKSLPESEAYHIYKVLRARPGTEILITDGNGFCGECILTEVSAKKASFQIRSSQTAPRRKYGVHMVIAPTRKAERNEWMVEKLVELGVDRIDFIKTTHIHLESYNRVVSQERLERIALAAMKQSRQFYLPEIRVGVSFQTALTLPDSYSGFIAYVPEKEVAPHLATIAKGKENAVVMIGPEGDFTQEEVTEALRAGFRLVSLGETRLRTETAAIAACHAIHLAQLP